MEYYVASRHNWDIANKVFGEDVCRINSRMQEILKDAAKLRGMQKRRDHREMYFYWIEVADEETLLSELSEQTEFMRKMQTDYCIDAIAYISGVDIDRALKYAKENWTDTDEKGRLNKEQYKGYRKMVAEQLNLQVLDVNG